MKITPKIITISIVIVIFVSFLIYALWYFFISPQKSSSLLPPNENQEEFYNSESARRILKISDQPIFDFWTIPETNSVYYLSYDGKIFETKKEEDIILSNQTINALNRINLSPNKQKVLASFGDPAKPKWGIFDLIDKIWRPLPSEIINVSWGSNDEELIGFINNNNQQSLVKINLNENPPVYKTIITDLRLEDVNLIFKKPNYLIITEKPTAFYESSSWLLNLDNLSISSLFKERGLIIKKSINNDIFFKFSNNNQNLEILNESFQILIPAILKTLPQKCEGVFGNLIYCFVPREIPTKIILPDDYFQNKFYSVDDLYLLNTDTGDVLTIIESGLEGGRGEEIIPPIDALNPQYVDGYLYFINRYDGYLYTLKLN